MGTLKTQTISLRIPQEDYGWLQRYSTANDMTPSQVMRKALKLYRVAIQKQNNKLKEQRNEANKNNILKEGNDTTV